MKTAQIIVISIIILAALLYYSTDIYESASVAVGHKTRLPNYNTIADLRLIEQYLNEYTIIHRRLIKEIASVSEYDMNGKEIYNISSEIFKMPSSYGMASPLLTDKARTGKTVYDFWGEEIKGRVKVGTNAYHIRLWSKGPNRIDENGRGDDTAYEFDIEIPLRKE